MDKKSESNSLHSLNFSLTWRMNHQLSWNCRNVDGLVDNLLYILTSYRRNRHKKLGAHYRDDLSIQMPQWKSFCSGSVFMNFPCLSWKYFPVSWWLCVTDSQLHLASFTLSCCSPHPSLWLHWSRMPSHWGTTEGRGLRVGLQIFSIHMRLQGCSLMKQLDIWPSAVASCSCSISHHSRVLVTWCETWDQCTPLLRGNDSHLLDKWYGQLMHLNKKTHRCSDGQLDVR